MKGQITNIPQADSLLEIEEYDAALKIYKLANQSYLEQEAYNEYLSMSITIAENLEELEESIEYLESAIKQTNNHLEEDSLVALSYHKLANLYYANLDDKSAIANWQKALNIRTKISPANQIDIIKCHRNIGNGWLNLSEWGKAKKHLQQSIDLNLSKTQVDSILLTKAYNNLGWAYTNLEDYYKADKLLQLSLTHYQHFFKEEPWMLIDVYENLAELYRRKKQFSKVIAFQKKILAIYNSFEDKWEEDYKKMANGYNNLGLGYEEVDSLNIALQQFNRAVTINQTFVTKNEQALAINFNNVSRIYRKKGQFKKAITLLDKAIVYDTKVNNTIGLSINLNDKSTLFLKQGIIKKALDTLERAIQIINPIRKDLILDKTLLVSLLADKLLILKEMMNRGDAINFVGMTESTIQEIITLTNQIRIGYQSDASKSFLAKKTKAFFENGIQLYIKCYEVTENTKYLNQAFQLSEQSKSIILMDALQQAQTNRTTNVPTVLLDHEDSLKRQIAAKEKALFLEEDVTILNNDLILLNQALEKLTDTLKQNYPKYHEAKYLTELPLINDIQNSIEGSLIEYFVGDSTIYVFKITKDQANIAYVEIPLNFLLATWVKQLREAIYKPFLQKIRSDEEAKKYAQDLVHIAYQLHQKLIAPIIQPSEANEKLIIIPDGILGYIPFDVLISEQPEDATLFGAHDYLINDFQISYAYSATSLLEMQQKQFTHKTTNDFVAFAPIFEEEKEVAFVQDIDAVRGELTPLEYNIPEVTAIQALIGGNLFTGMDATRANFIQNITNSRIVHLATHGKANDETGDYAFLAFTDLKDATDFRLYNRDLYNLALNADMVVLSACETGIGELQKGEGIISLARGFTYAGAKSIVTTLWSINDNRTKEIMEGFYSNLKNGDAKDVALRQAKLDFIDNYSHNAHPFFWAAFIPIGDMEVIDFSNDWGWKFGLIGIVGLLIFFFWWRRK